MFSLSCGLVSGVSSDQARGEDSSLQDIQLSQNPVAKIVAFLCDHVSL